LHRALENDIASLKANPDAARTAYDAGVKTGDFTRAHATVGEGVGLIRDIPTAETLIRKITDQARELLLISINPIE
jgi:nitronate monooxygenase